MIRSPFLRFMRNPPAKYEIEWYNMGTGFWTVVRSVDVIWPVKTVRGWFRTKTVTDYSGRKPIEIARRLVYDDLRMVLRGARIVEVKDTGHRYIIFQEGKWLTL